MTHGIHSALGSVKANIKARRQLQPESDISRKKGGSDPSYGISNMGASNKKKTGRYKGLA